MFLAASAGLGLGDRSILVYAYILIYCFKELGKELGTALRNLVRNLVLRILRMRDLRKADKAGFWMGDTREKFYRRERPIRRRECTFLMG